MVQVFGGAAGALAAMTVLSALMGWAAPSLVSTVPLSSASARDTLWHCQVVPYIRLKQGTLYADIQAVYTVWSSIAVFRFWLQDAV